VVGHLSAAPGRPAGGEQQLTQHGSERHEHTNVEGNIKHQYISTLFINPAELAHACCWKLLTCLGCSSGAAVALLRVARP